MEEKREGRREGGECHLLTLHPQLLLQEVHADGLLVALGEGAPAVALGTGAGVESFQLEHCTALHCTALHCTALHCTVAICGTWIMLDLPTAPLPTISTCNNIVRLHSSTPLHTAPSSTRAEEGAVISTTPC